MSNPRATCFAILSRCAGIVALCLAGCEVPVLQSVNPDTAARGNQNVQVTLAGSAFAATSRILIDGSLEGAGTPITLGQLTLVSPERLDASLHVSLNSFVGAHTIAVGDTAGISDPQYLYVSCAGCPPPPRLLSVSTLGGPELFPLIRGHTSTIRLRGRSFQNNNPRVSISGAGLAFDPNIADVDVDPALQVDFIDLPITVAADAPTGLREVRVNTSGGTSNPLSVTVLAVRQVPRVTGVTVSGSTSCALRRGLNDVFVTGYHFDLGTEIRVDFVAEGRVFQVRGVNTSLQDSRTIFTQIDVGSAPPDSFSIIAVTVGGESAAFPVSCNPERLPILRSLSPGVVTQGTEVFVKCEGENFHRGDPNTHSQQVLLLTAAGGAGGAHLLEAYLPATADEDKVLVIKLGVDAQVAPESSVVIYIRNQLGELSNPLALKIVRPPPGHYIATVTPDSITQGSAAQITIEGSFFGTVDFPFFRFSTPGLALSNPRTDPVNVSKITFDVQAAPDATLTNDDATNLVLGNPIAFQVLPKGGSNPTPTPTATPTPTPGPTLANLTPSRVTRGTSVFVRFEGAGFDPNGFIEFENPGGITGVYFFPRSGLPDDFRTLLLTIPADAESTLVGRFQDAGGNRSNPLTLSIDDPAPGTPFISNIDQGGFGAAT